MAILPLMLWSSHPDTSGEMANCEFQKKIFFSLISEEIDIFVSIIPKLIV